MPYLDASSADLQRSFRLADGDLPHGAVLVGTLSISAYQGFLRTLWPGAREVEERVTLVHADGRNIWFIVAFGAALAATFAHLAVKLGARAVLQLGAIGGLQPGWEIGQILVPYQVIGRDGVSRQLSRNRPLVTDPAMSAALTSELAASGLIVKHGMLVTTTTIAFERPMDIARWGRAGYAGVEMEAAATMAVATHFGVPAAGAFVLFDDLASARTVFALSDDDRRRARAAREPLARAAAMVVARASGA